MDLLGFWSYVHADDEVDMGRVAQLAKDIVGHYEALQAEQIELFLDADNLHWGDEWRDRVDDALSNVAFFIPVITPRYFKSAECRREFQFFLSKADSLGITKLILPILYIRVPELDEESPVDPLMRAVKRIQWEPWLDYRFTDRDSAEYRAAVNGLAEKLVSRVEEVERVDVAAAANNAAAAEEDDGGEGTLDKMAALEEAMPRWTTTLEALTAEIETIGNLMSQGAADIEAGEKQGKGFAARLTVARRVASDLGGPVAEIERLGLDFAADLASIDAGVRVILDMGEEGFEEADPDAQRIFCEFRATILGLAMTSRESLGSVQGMIDASGPITEMSKDMRPVVRRLTTSLTAMVEARDITDGWVKLIDESRIDCSPFDEQPAPVG